MIEFEHWSKMKPVNEREKYLIETIQKLEKELEQCRAYKKAGQKSFDNRDVVVQIFERYLNGGSLSEIADYLNKSGVKTKRGGSTWYKSTVKFLLQNREYVDNSYITEDVFNQVQDKLINNRLQKSEKKG